MSQAEQEPVQPDPMPRSRIDQERGSLIAVTERLTHAHLKMALIIALEPEPGRAAHAYDQAGALTRDVSLALSHVNRREELPAIAMIARGLVALEACRESTP